jgi:hypothetical protein
VSLVFGSRIVGKCRAEIAFALDKDFSSRAACAGGLVVLVLPESGVKLNLSLSLDPTEMSDAYVDYFHFPPEGALVLLTIVLGKAVASKVVGINACITKRDLRYLVAALETYFNEVSEPVANETQT